MLQKKIQIRILRQKRQKQPGVFSDLKHLTNIDKRPYFEANQLEFDTLINRGVIKIIERTKVPVTAKIGKCAVLFNTKRCGRVKCRCVYNGKTQRHKMCESFFSPTLIDDTLKLCCGIAAQKEWDYGSVDAKCAFPYANLPDGTQLFSEIPEGHPNWNLRKTHVLQILKNIYGTKEGPILWFKHIKKILTEVFGLKQSVFDECMFFSDDLIVLVYVDDLLIFSRRTYIIAFRDVLKNYFELTYTEINGNFDFLGVNISKRQDGSIILTQVEYIEKFLEKFKQYVEQSYDTPLPFNFKQKKENEVNKSIVENFPFREILGSIMYLRLTRPDLLFAIHLLGAVAREPTSLAVDAIKHCLGYIKQTKSYERIFYSSESKRDINIVAFTDAEWATNRQTRKSVSGNFIYFGSSLTYYKCRTQRQIATSSAAAELHEIFQTAKQIFIMFSMCKELKVKINVPTILTDSSSSVRTLEKSTQALQKHLGVYVHYLKELKERIGLKVIFIKRNENIADLQTKQPSKNDFIRTVKKLQEPFEWRHVKI